MICPIEIPKCRHCPNCGKEAITLYDSKLNAIPYDKYMMYKEQGINVNLEDRDLSHFKCDNCKTMYPVDRTSDFPYPLYDYDIRMQRFGEKNHRKMLDWR